MVSWCEKSDVNGLSKIFEYENVFVRFVLFILLLVSLGFTAWFMSWSILDYFERDIVSKIQAVYEKPTEFPAITFCDSQPFTTQQSFDFVNDFHNDFFVCIDCNRFTWIANILMDCNDL